MPDWGLTSAVLQAVTVVAALAVLVGVVVTVRRAKPSAEDVLTIVAAGIATAVSAQGMWRFFGDIVHLNGVMRALTFAFIELAMVTSAVRARKSMRENYAAGVDGIAVWALTCLSATLSALDARSLGEVVLRLAAPLVAAWLWERGMSLERRRLKGRTTINWRISPERILIWAGIADPTDRDAGEVDAQRRLMKLALAAKKARTAQETGTDRDRKRAFRRLERAMEAAVEYGGLGTDPDRQAMLVAQLGVLYNARSLLDLAPDAPWAIAPEDRTPDPAPEPDGTGTDPGHRHQSPEPGGHPVGSGPDPLVQELAAYEPAPAMPVGAVSPDRTADMSAITDRPEPVVDTGERGEMTRQFLQALSEHQGNVSRSREALRKAGRKPPSRAYAYELRQTWLTAQAAKSGHLTRVK